MSKASKVRQNDLCPCRSRKKYKYCCGSKARDSEPEETSHNRAIRLLRSYQENENVVAKDEGREPFSFEFLWDSLGISEDQKG